MKKEEYLALECCSERRDILKKLKSGDKTAFVNLFKYYSDEFIDQILYEVDDEELKKILKYVQKRPIDDLYTYCPGGLARIQSSFWFEYNICCSSGMLRCTMNGRGSEFYALFKELFDCFQILPTEEEKIEDLLLNKNGYYYNSKKEARSNCLDSIIMYLNNKKRIKELPNKVKSIFWVLSKPYLNKKHLNVEFIREIFDEKLPLTLKEKEIELLDAAYRKDVDLLRKLLKEKYSESEFKCFDFVETLSVKPLIDKVLDNTIVDRETQTDLQIDVQMDCEIIIKKKLNINELHKEQNVNKYLDKI